MPLRIAVLSIAVSLIALDSARAQTRVDSANVSIVEHASVQTTHIAFRIASTPMLRLGGLQSDERAEFSPRHSLLGTLRLSDGRVVVNDYTSVKIFDPSGRLLRVLGRRGAGPGEFSQTHSVCAWAGDSLVVRDGSLRRASVFTASGAFVRTLVIDGTPTGLGCFSDGSILVLSNERVNEHTTLPAERANFLDRVADFKRVSATERQARAIGTWRSFRGTAFQSPIIVRVVGDRIYFGDSQDASVRVHDENGKLIRIVRWREPRQRVTNDMIEERARSRRARVERR